MENFGLDIRGLMQTPTFLESNESDRMNMLRTYRDDYIQKNPDQAEYANSESESANRDFLRASGQGRYVPKGLSVETPWQDKEQWGYLSEDEKLSKIEEFKKTIPEVASQDSLNRSDINHFLGAVADNETRKAKGEDSGWIADKGYRAWDGFAAGLASYVGATEVAENIRRSTSENPNYDEDLTAQLFQGAGDMLASSVIFLGTTAAATAASGNPAVGVYAGTTATLGTNAISRYNEAYQEAINLGLTENQANNAGWGSVPGAAVDALGDKLIAGRFLPKNYRQVFAKGTLDARRTALAELAANSTKRGIIINSARDSFIEGFTEAAGDYAAGYGAYVATGEDSFVPTNKELANSFTVGLVLGGVATTASEVPGLVRGDGEALRKVEQESDRVFEGKPSDEDAANQVWKLLDEGKYKEGYELLKTIESTPFQEETVPADPAIPSTTAPLLATTEEDESQPLKSSPTIKFNDGQPKPIEVQQEEEAAAKLETAPPEDKEEFVKGIQNQYAAYLSSTEINSALGIQPLAETSTPINFRQGVAEDNPQLSEFAPGSGFASDSLRKYNNISLVKPGQVTGKAADFTVRERNSPEGQTNVAASPNLQTKIQEAKALGRAADVRSIAPVNKQDAQFIADNKIGTININSEGVETREYESGDEVQIIANQTGINNIAKQLDQEYGEGKWVVKDSQGAAGVGIYLNKQALDDALNEDGELELNGLYAEPLNEALANRSSPDFRVHIVKRGGKLEVVPFATSDRNSVLPYVLRTSGVLGLEQRALDEANKAIDQVAENAILGVDVVVGNDGQLYVPELNPTQFGPTADNYNAGGASGYVNTPYVQAALYAHLAGKVPAFALAGRQVLRDLHTQKNVEAGAGRIAANIKQMVGNARDANQLRGELLKAYGERFADKSQELWDAFIESGGQITRKILDIIQNIINYLKWKPVNTNVSTANQGLMDNVNAIGNTAIGIAKAETAKQKNALPSKDGGQLVYQGININSALGLVQFTEEDSYFRELAARPEVAQYLEGIGVVRDGTKTYFDGKVIALGLTDNPDRIISHELSHALLDSALDNNQQLRQQMERLRIDLMDQLGFDSAPNALLRFAGREYGKIKNRPETFSQFFANNLNEITKRFRNEADNLYKNVTESDMLASYALTGGHEFLAAVMSDKDFRKKLQNTSVKTGKSLWSQFMNWVKKVLGIKNSDTNALSKLESLIQEYTPEGYDPSKFIQEFGQKQAITARNKRKAQLKRLKELKTIKLDDRYDSNTSKLLKIAKRFRPSDIALLEPEMQERVFELTDNLHQARVKKAKDPAARIDTTAMLKELNLIRMAMEPQKIKKMISDHDGILNLKGAPEDDLDAFITFLNSTAEKDKAFQDAKANASAKKKARYNQKMEAWRKSFKAVRQQIQEQFSSAEDYIQALEELEGQPIKGKKLREFIALHFDYLTSLANVDAMDVGDLYRHFFSINNMLDFSMMYGNETTIEYIRGLRDSGTNFEALAGKFRDPVINHGRGVLGGLDAAQRKTEIAQTQIQRWSAFSDAKDWLQKDLLGPMLETIMIEAHNSENASLNRYYEAKKEFEKVIGRDFNSEDTVSMALASRLIQFETGTDGNAAFKENIANERRAIENIIGTPARNGQPAKDGAGDPSQQSDYKNVIIPIFEKLVEGLENSPNAMEQFIININSRLGLGDEAVGAARSKLLTEMQSIIGEYTLDNKIVSEMFYKKPFRQYANYMPRLTLNISPEKVNTREGSIADEVSSFENNPQQTNSVTAQPEQLKERSGIGKNGHYSNNIEYVLSRGLHVASLTSATTVERHLLSKRLKSGPVRDLINGSNSTYRVDQLQQWARNVMLHAMHSGQPLGTLGVAMKVLNENFARVALSGFHQGITQAASGYVDYFFRTGNITGAMQSASYYIGNKTKMDEFFQKNLAWIGNRSFLGEQELDRRRAPSFDEKKIRNSAWVKKLEKFHHKAGDIITYSLRKGDDFTARSLVMAEYLRLLQEKNPEIKSLEQVDWNATEGNILSQAVLNIEQNINASNKVTRGELFVDRNWGMAMLRNVTMAFSSHVMMLAGQFNIATRDLINLNSQGGSDADKARAIRTIGAILGQSLTFTSGRYAINSALAVAMVALMRDMFDDEEGKLAQLQMRVDNAKRLKDEVGQAHAENELKSAIAIRQQIDKFSQRQTSFGSYWKNVVKDELGSMHFMFNGPQLPQKLIFPVFDRFGEDMMKEDQKAKIAALKDKITKLKKQKKFGDAARVSEQLIMLENAEYLPWQIDQFGNIGIGGITGTALDAAYKSIHEFTDSAMGLQEVSSNDFLIAAQSTGMGQADLLRFTKVIDKIEDEQFKLGVERVERQKAAKEKKRKEQVERQRRIDEAVLRQQLNN